MHDIRVDHETGLVEFRLSGLPGAEDVIWGGEEIRQAVLSLGDRVGSHLTLYDVRAVPVVPPVAIDAVRDMFANPAVRPLWARRVAFVVGSALGRMQVERLREARADIGIFEDRDAALAWLLG